MDQRLVETLRSKIPKSPLTYFFVCVFGIGSWIAINGIWAEISILVITTPECAKLPSQLVVIVQVANIGPLLYTAVKYLLHRCKNQEYLFKLEIVTISILILIGTLASVLLSIFWNVTVPIEDNMYSISLYLLAFFLALVDCTSSVVFIPFMKHFSSEYLSALYIGEGLSGLLPSLFALTQGSVDNNITCNGSYPGHEMLGIRFSPNVFFIFLGGMMLVCGIAFLSIITLPAVRKQRVSSGATSINSRTQEIKGKHEDILDSGDTGQQDTGGDQSRETLLSSDAEIKFSFTNMRAIIWSNASLFLCLLSLSFLTNGALSAVSPFAFLPYGNSVYHIAVNLALLANPLMSFFFAIVRTRSKVITAVMTVLTLVMGIYVIVMAQSPAPVYQSHLFARIFVVSKLHVHTSCSKTLFPIRTYGANFT